MSEPMEGWVELYQATDGWRWRRKAENGEIVGTGEAYQRRIDAYEIAEKQYPGIPIIPASAPWDDETDAA